MTIKQFLDKYFEDSVPYDDERGVYIDQSFWDAWDKIEQDIDRGGIQWALEWYDDAYLTEDREKYICKAIYKYIQTKIKPIYINY